MYFQMDILFDSTEHTHWKIAGFFLLAAYVLIPPAFDAYRLFTHKKEIMEGEEELLALLERTMLQLTHCLDRLEQMDQPKGRPSTAPAKRQVRELPPAMTESVMRRLSERFG